MAKEEKKEEAGGEATTATSLPTKKSAFKWVLIGVLGLTILGGGGAFAWWKLMAPHKEQPVKEDGKASETNRGEGKEATKGKESGQKVEKMGPIVDLDPFIVNLSDADPRYLKLTVKLEVETSEAKAEVTERTPQIRDAILILLTSKDSQSLRPAAGKLQLRDEILQRVNPLLSSGEAKNAYFTEFVVQ
jgi:flagellar FliL protein